MCTLSTLAVHMQYMTPSDRHWLYLIYAWSVSATLGPSYRAICGFLATVLGCLYLDLTSVVTIWDSCKWADA